jgi:hypothetical protein
MADIKLGLTREAVEGAKETYDGPRTPFPANRVGYTKYSALVTDIQIKTSADGNKSWLWLQVTNGAHQESILINLDPSDIAPTTPPDQVSKAVDRNLQTLLRAVKVLGISNAAGDGIDTSKFERAKGTLIAFGVKQGDLNQNTGYYKYYTSFYGKAESLVPVSEPVGGAASGSAEDDDDIPF